MYCAVASTETLRDLILEARKKLRVTNRAVGNAVGVSDQAISDYLRGVYATPNWASNWLNLAPLLRVSVERLQAAVENTFAADSSQDNVSATIPTTATRKSVPIYHFVPANRVGGPDDFYSEQQDYEPKMIEVEVTSDRCMVIVLDGDCMEPQFPHGAKMLVDWDAVEKDGMKEGDFYFIRTRGEDNGRCTFKQYAGKDKSGKHQFRCLNPKYRGIIRFKAEFDAARAMHRIL
jgi:phage repressor protein C with HTH and peptisase S24 domain